MDQWWQTLIAKNLKQTSGDETLRQASLATQPTYPLVSLLRDADSSGEIFIRGDNNHHLPSSKASSISTTNMDSGEESGNGDHCNEWTPTQHPLLKLSMALLILGFLIPPKRHNRYLVILFRLFLSAASSVGVFWGVRTCSPDVIIWNFLFLGVNVFHALYNLYRLIPPRIIGDSKRMYERHFLPYKVSKKSFIRFRTSAWQCDLDAGHEYFGEGSRGAAQNISMLVSGRLVVSYQGTYLHDIRPMEFVDSLEWQWRDRNEDRLETRFQVTITASEDSSLLCWRVRDMENLKTADQFVYTIFDHIVAMDAISKLYRCASGGTRSRAVFSHKSPVAALRRHHHLSTIDSIGEEDEAAEGDRAEGKNEEEVGAEEEEDGNDRKRSVEISDLSLLSNNKRGSGSPSTSGPFLEVPLARR